MKIEFEIDMEEIKTAMVEKIAQDMAWRVTHDKRDEILKKLDYSKMAPFVQEAILKMAASKLFGEKV